MRCMFSDWVDKILKGLNHLFLLFKFPKYFGQNINWTFIQRSLPRELIHKTHKDWFQPGGFKTIIDMDANMGAFSYAVRVFLPNAHIYAFKPLPDCFDQIVKNVNSFGNFIASQAAIGDQNRQMEKWNSFTHIWMAVFFNRMVFFTVNGSRDEK
jgi:hypothetical protein